MTAIETKTYPDSKVVECRACGERFTTEWEEGYCSVCEACRECEHPLVGYRYVNVYSVGRYCGGPEEGGWYFDAGTPIESVAVPAAIAHTTALMLEEKYRELDESTRSRFSVLAGEDILVRIETHFARPFPEETPRYE